jgi:long-subunit fatty acid transport protein
MKMNIIKNLTKSLLFVFLIVVSFNGYTQEIPKSEQKSEFWKNVQFGGGLGLSVGSGFTDITIAPSAIYNFNDYVSLGLGVQGSYISSKNNFNSTLVGGSLIALFNPIEVVQLSLEVEEVNVNTKYLLTGANSIRNNYWNTGLFVGVGYRMDNVTIGARYNLLYDKDKSVYNDALMPFIRVYF